jgi:hypothetical protein
MIPRNEHLMPELTGRGEQHPTLEDRAIMKSIQSALRLSELLDSASREPVFEFLCSWC